MITSHSRWLLNHNDIRMDISKWRWSQMGSCTLHISKSKAENLKKGRIEVFFVVFNVRNKPNFLQLRQPKRTIESIVIWAKGNCDRIICISRYSSMPWQTSWSPRPILTQQNMQIHHYTQRSPPHLPQYPAHRVMPTTSGRGRIVNMAAERSLAIVFQF